MVQARRLSIRRLPATSRRRTPVRSHRYLLPLGYEHHDVRPGLSRAVSWQPVGLGKRESEVVISLLPSPPSLAVSPRPVYTRPVYNRAQEAASPASAWAGMAVAYPGASAAIVATEASSIWHWMPGG